jgi:hypothetical protein
MHILELPQDVINIIFLYLADRYGLLRCVCKSWGYLSLKTQGEVACETFPMTIYAGAEATCPRASGNLEILKYLKKKCVWDTGIADSVIYRAACGGHLETLKWLYSGEGLFFAAAKDNIYVAAARYGQIEVLAWLGSWREMPSNSVFSTAARYGRIKVLDWMVEHSYSAQYSVITYAAIRGKQIESLKWLYRRSPWSDSWDNKHDVVDIAALTGQIKIIKWLHSIGCPWGVSTANAAAVSGQIEVLEWLHLMGCPWDSTTLSAAVTIGYPHMLDASYLLYCTWIVPGTYRHSSVETIEWLRSKGCPWDSNATMLAAQSGDFDILKWLHREGCPWDENTTKWVALRGRIDILEWLHDKGCPWDKEALKAAVIHGSLNVVQWLHSKGCPWGEEAILEAAIRGHINILKWMRRLPVGERSPWGFALALYRPDEYHDPIVVNWMNSLSIEERNPGV